MGTRTHHPEHGVRAPAPDTRVAHESAVEPHQRAPTQLANTMRPALAGRGARVVAERAQGGKSGEAFAMYLGGFHFAKNDAILVVAAYNLLTTHRQLSMALAKSKVCRCGCRGGDPSGRR